MKISYIGTLTILLTVALLTSGVIAGHHYHGYGMRISEMSEVDANNDGVITFDEFSAPQTEKLRSGFNMIDTNNDGELSKEEYNEFLRVHGFETKSDG
jgi:hypothetical protein